MPPLKPEPTCAPESSSLQPRSSNSVIDMRGADAPARSEGSANKFTSPMSEQELILTKRRSSMPWSAFSRPKGLMTNEAASLAANGSNGAVAPARTNSLRRHWLRAISARCRNPLILAPRAVLAPRAGLPTRRPPRKYRPCVSSSIRSSSCQSRAFKGPRQAPFSGTHRCERLRTDKSVYRVAECLKGFAWRLKRQC